MAGINVKASRTLLASAARTVQTASAVAPRDSYSLGIRIYLNITAASGTGGLQCILRGYDPVSDTTVNLSAGGTAVTATGTYVYEIYPGIQSTVTGSVKERVSCALPVKWDVLVAVGDSSSYTYSVGAEVLS